MSNNILEGLVKEKDYNFKKFFFKIILECNLSLNELILIIYFSNQVTQEFDINKIMSITYLEKSAILEAFASLTSKNLVVTKIVKDDSDKISEVIDLDNLYKKIVCDINTVTKKKLEVKIFEVFEQEFGRPLSPIELELINAWLKSGTSEEIIIGALKEASYNGVRNLRYIDKIIYEWGKKGFKTMADVTNHLKGKSPSQPTEKKALFEYNWLDDDE